MLASPPLSPISLLWLLIQLPARTSNGLNSKSKETFSGVKTGAVMLLQKHPSTAKNFSDCSDKVALIDCSCSINQVWPGAWHRRWVSVVMRSGPEWSRLLSFVSLTLFISFTHLPSGPLGSGVGRRWLLQASQTSEDLTRLWDESSFILSLMGDKIFI